MIERNWQERVLVILLRIGGVMTILAFPTIFLPVSWMAATHAWLGMGEFPRTPIVDYLARSIAALYGFHGVLLLIISTNVRRFRPLVVYAGCMNLVLGPLMLGIDLHAGMPWYWTAVEGPPLIAMGGLLLFLARAVRVP